jgi:hypothetical protein
MFLRINIIIYLLNLDSWNWILIKSNKNINSV